MKTNTNTSASRVFFSILEFGLYAGLFAGLVRTVLLVIDHDYLNQGLYRLLGMQSASILLSSLLVSLVGAFWFGWVVAWVWKKTASRLRCAFAVCGMASFYLASLFLMVRQLGKKYGSFFPDAYQYHPVRFDTVLRNFVLPEGAEAFQSMQTAGEQLVLWIPFLLAGVVFGLVFQWLVSIPLGKRKSLGQVEFAGPNKAGRLRITIRLFSTFLVFMILVGNALPNTPSLKGGVPIVWISLDTLRADRLGCYGYQRGTSPRIDELAKESIVFDRAISPSPWTLPTHISLLTGQYPSAHGVVDMNRKLPGNSFTLPEALKNAGYRTSAVVSSYMLSPQYGYDQGFDTYRFRPKALGPEVTDTALSLLKESGKQPFFLFVHYFDVHYPFTPPVSDLLQFANEETIKKYTSKTWPHYYDYVVETMQMEDEEYRFQLDAYDAGILSVDRQVARIIDSLKEMGLWDEVFFVITSDHGEEWKEHGFLGHSITLYDEVIRVPLIIKPPKSMQIPACRIDTVVSLNDLTTTTAQVAGLNENHVFGTSRSLVPLMNGSAIGWQPLAFSESEIWGPFRKATILGGMKYIEPFSFRFGEFEKQWPSQLYDTVTDPSEQNNLAIDEVYRVELHAMIEASKLFATHLNAGQKPDAQALEMAPAMNEKLRALGYME